MSGLAVVSAIVFYLIATTLFGANLLVGTDTELTLLRVVVVTLVVSALAVMLAGVLDRFAWGRTVWTVFAAFGLLGATAALFQLGLANANLAWQAVLYAVFGLLLIIGFYVGWPPRNPEAATP